MDTTNLKAAVDELLAQVEQTKGVQASAVTLITGFADLVAQKVTEAIQANDAIDNAAIEPIVAAIQSAKSEMLASTTTLGDAVAANAGGGSES